LALSIVATCILKLSINLDSDAGASTTCLPAIAFAFVSSSPIQFRPGNGESFSIVHNKARRSTGFARERIARTTILRIRCAFGM
jgi:hypothetical protein